MKSLRKDQTKSEWFNSQKRKLEMEFVHLNFY